MATFPEPHAFPPSLMFSRENPLFMKMMRRILNSQCSGLPLLSAALTLLLAVPQESTAAPPGKP